MFKPPNNFNRFGFVTFHHDQDAVRVLESNNENGVAFGNSLLNISYAYRKPPHNLNFYGHNNNTYFQQNKNSHRDTNNNNRDHTGDFSSPCTVHVDNSKFGKATVSFYIQNNQQFFTIVGSFLVLKFRE